MTLQTFRDLLGERPFKPFRLVMSSEETYDIKHPEMAFLSRTAIYVGVGGDDVPENFRILSLLHVATVEPLGTPADRR